MLQTNYISQFNYCTHNITSCSHSFTLSSDHAFLDSIRLSTCMHIQHPPPFRRSMYLFSQPSRITRKIFRNHCFSPATLKLIKGHDRLTRIQYFALYSLLHCTTEGSSKKRHLRPRLPTAIPDAVKPAMAFLSTKLTTQNLAVAISRGNVLNMVLVLPRLSFHLLQSTRCLIVLLLQVKCILFVKILFNLATPT